MAMREPYSGVGPMAGADPYGAKNDPTVPPGGRSWHDPYPSFEDAADAEDRHEGADDARARGLGKPELMTLKDWEKRLLDRGYDAEGTPFDAEPEEVDGPEAPPSAENDPQGGVSAGPYGATEGSADAGSGADVSASVGVVSAVGGIRRYGRIQVYFSNPSLTMQQSDNGLARASIGSTWFGGTDACPDGLAEALRVLDEMFDLLDNSNGWIKMAVPLGNAEGHPGEPSTDVVIRSGAVDYMTVEEGVAPRVE